MDDWSDSAVLYLSSRENIFISMMRKTFYFLHFCSVLEGCWTGIWFSLGYSSIVKAGAKCVH